MVKIECKQGWFKVRQVIGRRFEVTYYDGKNIFCENIRRGNWRSAADYCRAQIDAS